MRTERAASMKERGSVLLHVMVTGVLVALIAASLLRVSMLRSQMGGRSAKILQEKRDDQGALAGVLAAWNAVNKVCGAVPAGFAAAGCLNAGICDCICTQMGANPATVTAWVNGGVCQLDIKSTDIP